MGLDAVELVMAVEEAFAIQIEDDAAAKMFTPRDVIDYVWRKVAHADAAGCQTQRAFNLLRKTLVQSTGLPRRAIRPAASLNELIPKPRRKPLRDELNAILDTHAFPSFVRSRELVASLTLASIGTGLGAVVVVTVYLPAAGVVPALLFGLLTAGAAGYAGAAATRSLCTEFAPAVGTAGDLSRWIMCHRRDSTGGDSTPKWTREQVSARVREIVIEQLNCAAEYREDARFIEDLGLS